MSQPLYFTLGGGLGDCVWDFLNNQTSYYLKSLNRDYNARIRVYTRCHNSGISDLFAYQPYIHEHVTEPWCPPNPEDTARFNEPIDGYWPIHRMDYLQMLGCVPGQYERPQIHISTPEKATLAGLISQRPAIVMQPWAGLSDRDAFDNLTLARLVDKIVHLSPDARIIIVGKNHERGCKYQKEELLFTHPNVVNLIDKIGIRLAYHLVANCDAYCGSHSNLIRTAWDFRKRNVTVLPDPLMTNHVPQLDRKYTYGWTYPESKIFTFPFDGDLSKGKGFDRMDLDGIAQFLIRGN